MKYDLLNAHTMEDLTRKVMYAIGNGWVPQGGVAITADQDSKRAHLIQAVAYNPHTTSK